MRGFFFREEHHASQPVLGWFYFSKLTDMDFDRKNSEMQRCCDLLNVTKVFNGRIQTIPGATKDTSAQGPGAQSVWMGFWHHWLSPRASCAHRARRGFPGLWVVARLKDTGKDWTRLVGAFCLVFTVFTLICCQRKYIMWREQYHKQHTPTPQFQLLTYLLHFYPTLLPFPPLDYFAANLDISAHCKHSLCVSITKKLFYNPF